jgi:magnesium transporter
MVEDVKRAVAIGGQGDGRYALSPRLIAAILFAVEAGNRTELIALMDGLHTADIADLFEQVNTTDRRRLITLYGRALDGDILSDLDEGIREEVIAIMQPEDLADAVRALESDDVVDLLEDLEGDAQEAILSSLEDVDRVAVEKSLSYPEFSAGRLMQREVVMGPAHWTVGAAIDFMRETPVLPEDFYHMVLVDPMMHPIGHVTLGKILGAPRDLMLRDLLEPGFRTFRVDESEADVAYAFNQYHVISAPVLDADERIVGVITIDDAMTVLDDEHEEDILRLAGVGEGSLSDRVLDTVKQRLPWLGVNLVTAILASLVIAQFEATISQFVALAVLMPIVASMGGNAGTQALTVAVRAIATRDLTAANVWRVIRREVMVGLVNGVVFAVIMGVVGLIWFGSPLLGGVIAVAMVINMVVAGLAGIGVPVLLERFGIDPALASGAFVTTVTDVVGFLAFLGLAAAVLL